MKPADDIAAWSKKVAWLAVDALVDAELVLPDYLDEAAEIVALEILARLAMGDRPPETSN